MHHGTSTLVPCDPATSYTYTTPVHHNTPVYHPTPVPYTTSSMESYSLSSSLTPTHHVTTVAAWPQLVFFVTYWGFINANGVNVRDVRSSKVLPPPSTVLEDLILPTSSSSFSQQDPSLSSQSSNHQDTSSTLTHHHITSSSSQTFTQQDTASIFTDQDIIYPSSSLHRDRGSSQGLTSDTSTNNIHQREPVSSSNGHRQEQQTRDANSGGTNGEDGTNGEGSNKHRQQANQMDATSYLQPSTGFPPSDTGWDKQHPPLHSIATPSLTTTLYQSSGSQSETSVTTEGGNTAQLNSGSSKVNEDQIINSDIQNVQSKDTTLSTDSLFRDDYSPTSSPIVVDIPAVSESDIYDSSVLILRESTQQAGAGTLRHTPIVTMTTVQDDVEQTSSVLVRHNDDFVGRHQQPQRNYGGRGGGGTGGGDHRRPQKHGDMSVASTPGVTSSTNIVNSEVSQVSQSVTPIVTEGSTVSSSSKTLLSQPLSAVTDLPRSDATVNVSQSQLSQAMSTDSLVGQPMSKVTGTSSNDNMEQTLLSKPVSTITVSALTDSILTSPSLKPIDASRHSHTETNIPSSITKPDGDQLSPRHTKNTQTLSSQVEEIYKTQTLSPSISGSPSLVPPTCTRSITPPYPTSGLYPEDPLNSHQEVYTPQLPITTTSIVPGVPPGGPSVSLYVIRTSAAPSGKNTQSAEPHTRSHSSDFTESVTEGVHLYHTQSLHNGTVILGAPTPSVMAEATYIDSSYTIEVPEISTEWQGPVSSYQPSVHSPYSGTLPQAFTDLSLVPSSMGASSGVPLASKSQLHTPGGRSHPASTPVPGTTGVVSKVTLSSSGGSVLIRPTQTMLLPTPTVSPTSHTERSHTLQTTVSETLSPSLTVETRPTPTASQSTPDVVSSSSVMALDLFSITPLPAEVTSTPPVHVPPDSPSQQPEVSTPVSIATVAMTTASDSDLVVKVTSAAVTWQAELVTKEDLQSTSTGNHDNTLPLVTSATVTKVTTSPQGAGTKRGDNTYVTKTKGSKPKGRVTSAQPSTTVTQTTILFSAITTAPARPSVYVTIKLRMTWTAFCSRVDEFKRVLKSTVNKSVHDNYKVVVNGECSNVKNVARRSVEITVDVYLADKDGRYSIQMTSTFAKFIKKNRRILDQSPGSFKGKFIKVVVVGLDISNNLLAKQKEPSPSMTTAMVAGIAVASILSSAILGLIITQMVIIAKRRSVKKMRAVGYDSSRPSIDVHSLEESIQMISIATMAGGLSYINPAMDSDENKNYTSNPLTLADLEELLSDPDSEDIEDEFLMLPNPMPKISEVPVGVEDKNRYANVIPIRETRVPLVVRPGCDHSDYINANYVRGYGGKSRTYIATQAPMDNTRTDFWEMIWQQQTQVILMLTGIEENGHSKCSEYWPNTEGSDVVRIYGDYHVQLQLRDVTSFWIRSVLILKNMETNLRREVQHLWLTTWPPSGVPDDPCVVLAFLEAAEPYIQRSHGPPLVHCSPGTGRTGTLLAVDMGRKAWDLTHCVDVLHTVRQLREDRAGAIQTKEQYTFIYKTLLEHAHHMTDPSTASMTSSLISEPA